MYSVVTMCVFHTQFIIEEITFFGLRIYKIYFFQYIFFSQYIIAIIKKNIY